MMIYLIPVLVFLSLLAGAWAVKGLVFSPEAKRSQSTSRRLKHLTPRAANTAQAAVRLFRDDSLSSIPFLHRILSRLPRISDFTLYLHQAGNPCNLGTLVLAMALFFTLGFIVGIFRDSILLSILAGLACASLPLFWLHMIRKRRLATFEEQFPEAVELLARALRAGHSFGSALQMAAEELDDPVSDELSRTFEAYTYGRSMEDALLAMSRRVGLQDVKFFATAVNMQRETGGNLTELLDNIGHIIRERFRLMRQVKALSAEGRLSGTILSIMAPALLLVLWTISPKYISQLFTHPTGEMMLWVGLGFEVTGILVIRRLIKMKV